MTSEQESKFLAANEIEAIRLRMPDSESCVVTAITKLITDFVDSQFEETDDQLEYQLILINGRGDREIDMVLLPCPVPPQDRRFRSYLEHCCKSFQPFMVVQYFESWTVLIEGEDEKRDFDEWKRDNDNDLSSHPNVRSRVTLTLERHEGMEMWNSLIDETGDKRTLGAWSRTDTPGTTTSGRLANLLADSLH